MAGATVVVLGGGIGGVAAASELRRRLGKEHRVVIVDRASKHVFWPSLLWLQMGLRKPDAITRDLASLSKKGIEVIHGEVQAIDPQRKAVQVNGTELVADYLVISLGAELAPEQIPGLATAGHNLYSLDGSIAIRDTRNSLTEGALVVLVARTPFKCPAAPYEAAMLLDYDLRKRNLRQRVTVSIYTPEPGPMMVAGPDVSAGVKQLLEERSIAYYPQHQVAEVANAGKTVRFTNGAETHYNFLVYVPPHVAPTAVREAGLTGDSGWVPVDSHTLETKFPNIYAIGDVTGIRLAAGMPLPKAGVFAHREAEAVAQSIAARITGGGSEGAFDGHGECFIEVGGGKAGFGRGNFYAEPRPTVKLYKPGRHWHAGKILFEKDWFRRWF